MKRFLSATQFITILPVGRAEDFDAEHMAPFFPLVGLLCGAILAGCDMLFTQWWPVPVASVLDVLVLVVLTGAFHLDGLSDTADGLFSHRPPEKMMAIMKDSRIGAMGMVATVSILAVKWAGISSLHEYRFWFLLIVPAYARGSMLIAMKALPYGRPESGLGRDMFSQPMGMWFYRFLWIPVLCSLTTGVHGMMINLVFPVLVGLILLYYRRKLGCITGDMLGAMTEVTEAFLFLYCAAGGGV